MLIRKIRILAAATTVLLLAACQTPGAEDKAGSTVTTLRLATIDHVNNNGQSYGPQAFVDGLSAVSGGKLKVEVVEEYGSGDASAESDLVEAIASGDLDGGWPATRAFAKAGISGLEAVEAPMIITSYAAQKELVSGSVGAAVLKQLDGSGVVGLGLSVGPLRRPFAAKSPLLEPADWKGIRFRTYNSPVQADVMRALGAVPVNVGFGWIDDIRSGKLGGAEFDVAQYHKNGHGTEAGQVTGNVVLWPKVFVLSVSQKRFDSLSDEQRRWVQQAASQAVQASVDASYPESELVSELCGRGVEFRDASAAQLASLKKAIQPVLDRLAADATSGPLLAELQNISAAHHTDSIDPQLCAAEQQTGPLGTIPNTTSALPSGTYRVAVTVDDLTKAGSTNSDGGFSGTWTLKVSSGKFDLSCRPLQLPGTDCAHEVQDRPLEVGDLRGSGNVVYFVYDPARLARMTGCKLPVSQTAPGHCFDGKPYRMDWAIDGDQLIFSNYRSDNWPNDMLIAKPWRKIS